MENSLIRKMYKNCPLISVAVGSDGKAGYEDLEIEAGQYVVMINFTADAQINDYPPTLEEPGYTDIKSVECTLDSIEVYKDGELTDITPDRNQITLIEVILTRNTIIE